MFREMTIVELENDEKNKRRDDHQDNRNFRRDREYDDRYKRDKFFQHARLRDEGDDEKNNENDDVTKKNNSSNNDISLKKNRRIKIKLHRKKYLTAEFANVMTIHATNNVYKFNDDRKKRNKLIKKKLIVDDAHRLKNKARFQDVVVVDIATLEIKETVNEWKKMHEQRKKYREFEHKRA